MRPLFLLSLTALLACGDKDTDTTDTTGTTEVDEDGDGYSVDDGDCDDNNSLINPGVDELCDGFDNNCDGETDEGVTTPYYADADGDGFGDEADLLDACEQPEGYVPNGNDCDDGEAASFPGNTEVCDEIDNNCDGTVDEDVTTAFYADFDKDGYGDPDSPADACEVPAGYVEDNTDCDDTRTDVSPEADEVCDEVDNNCDTVVDEGVTTTYYVDADGDLYGRSDKTTEACALPGGHSETAGDCDDAASAIHPDATEICDDIDNDCDALTDDADDSIDSSTQDTWYADSDGDRYGDPGRSTLSCDQPSGYVSDNTDCDDAADTVYPGASEVCDGVYNDCDDADYDASSAPDDELDDDGDRYVECAYDSSTWAGASTVAGGEDCDDTEDAVYPSASEVCDGIYNDCDDTDYDASSAPDDELDGDGDSHVECEYSSGDWLGSATVSGGDDCDDDDETIYPNADELCDGQYNDCDDGSFSSSGAPDDESDLDGDGYVECAYDSSVWVGDRVDGGDDCDDTEDVVYPGASEVCDGIYNDCDDADYDASSAPDDELDGDGDSHVECEYSSGDWLGSATVSGGDDCDDSLDVVYPGASEACDGVYNDCDDADYSSSGAPDDESDLDGDGYVECDVADAWEGDSVDGGADCDDGDETIYPSADELCDGDGYVACEYDESAWVGASVDGGEDCDDDDDASYPGAEEECDDVDNNCDGEVDDGTLGLTEDCPAYSCLEIIEDDSSATDGEYFIDPDEDGDETEVYCDMTTDGGGYTYLKVYYYNETGSTAYATTAETYCDDLGMQLFVPRTSDHLQASLDIADDSSIGPSGTASYMYILGIYPTTRGNRCTYTGFNSGSCTGWAPFDGGPYYVGTSTSISEPNGDNGTTASMYYSWSYSSGAWYISWYNDINAPGYSSHYFMCQVGDKWGDGVDRGD